MAAPHRHYLLPREGHAWVTCWCERQVVAVPVDDIGIRTDTCGAKNCQPPERSAP